MYYVYQAMRVTWLNTCTRALGVRTSYNLVKYTRAHIYTHKSFWFIIGVTLKIIEIEWQEWEKHLVFIRNTSAKQSPSLEAVGLFTKVISPKPLRYNLHLFNWFVKCLTYERFLIRKYVLENTYFPSIRFDLTAQQSEGFATYSEIVGEF